MVIKKPSPSPSPVSVGTGGLSSAEMNALQRLGERLAMEGGGAASGRFAGDVYMGSKPGIRLEGRGYYGGGDIWLSGDEAELTYNDWTAKQRADFIAKAKVGGLIDINGGEVEGGRIWRELVKEAAYFGANKKQKVSPWDLLNGYVKDRGGSGPLGEWQKDPSNNSFEINVLTGERRYIGPRFKTTTETRIDMTDPATAAAVATRVFQDLMGRDPAKGELGTFAKALNEAEAKNPITSTTTTEYDPVTGEPVGQSSVSSGGLDSAGKAYIAEKNVKKTKEYKAVQAVTTYQNAIENAVWGAPELGG